MPRSNERRGNGYRRDSLSRWLRSLGNPCHICHLPIDYSLPPRDMMCFEVDELVPVSLGGDPLDRRNVAAAHRCCNIWRGNRMTWIWQDAPPHHGGRFLPHKRIKPARQRTCSPPRTSTEW